MFWFLVLTLPTACFLGSLRLINLQVECRYLSYISEMILYIYGRRTICRLNRSVIFFKFVGSDEVPRYCGHFWPIVQTPDDRWGWLWSNWWDEDWQGKPKYSEKTCPSAILSTTNSTWSDPGSNPGRRGGKPATNRLSYGAEIEVYRSGVKNCIGISATGRGGP
jgi:hypothetical protein